MSFLSFVGGFANQYNEMSDAERASAAEAKKAAAERMNKIELKKMELKATEEADIRKAEREAAAKREERSRRTMGAIGELNQLQAFETEEQPYLSMSGEYPEVKFVKLGDKQLTEEDALGLAKRQNLSMQDTGYLAIAVPRDDNKGWKTVVKDAKEISTSQLFKTDAKAREFADDKLKYYKSLNVSMIPVFEQQKEGISVKFVQPNKESAPSSLYQTQVEAQQAAIAGMEFYESRPDLKGKFVPKISQTDKGWKTEFVQRTAEKDTGVKKDPDIGVPYDQNFVFARSPKLGGPELAQKKALSFDAISLNGNAVKRFGEEQKNQVEDTDYLVIQKQGLGDTAAERVENHAMAIQRDLTEKNVTSIIASKDSPAGARAYDVMVGTFRNFVNSYKAANTQALTDRIVVKPIEEAHPWLANYMEMDSGIKEVLNVDLSPRAATGTPMSSLMPINEPVKQTVEGQVRMLRPNLSASAFVEQVKDPQDPTGKNTVPAYNANFLNDTAKFIQDSGVGQAAVFDILDTAVDPSTGESSPRAAEFAFNGLKTVKTKLGQAGTFVATEGGALTYTIPPMATQTKIDILSEVNRFSDHNNRIVALQTALPATTVSAANGQMKDPTAKGRYEAVTGGGMKWTVVSEQLANAQEMMGSINGLEEALVRDRSTGEQGEVGLVLNIERLSSGVGYMFEALSRNLTTDEDVDRDGLFSGLQKQIDEAVAETDVEKKNNALVKLYGTMLSYQLARLMDPNGRLSDEDRRTIEDGIGLMGVSANPDAILSLTQELRGKVEYIQARNSAYSSNSTNRILAAHLYDNLSDGGNFKQAFYSAMQINPRAGRGGPKKGTLQNNSGVTIAPEFSKLLAAKKKQAQKAATPAEPQGAPQQQSLDLPAPQQPVEIPEL